MFILRFLRIFILDDFYSFLDFWFFHLPQKLFRKTIDFIYSIDAEIKIKSHLKNLFKPFYGGKGILLTILSFPFRILIIILGALFYSLIFFIISIFIFFLIIFPIILFLIFLNILDYGILFRK